MITFTLKLNSTLLTGFLLDRFNRDPASGSKLDRLRRLLLGLEEDRQPFGYVQRSAKPARDEAEEEQLHAHGGLLDPLCVVAAHQPVQHLGQRSNGCTTPLALSNLRLNDHW